MNKKTLVIRFVEASDNARLTEFRISQLITAKQFKLLKPELLSIQRGYTFLVEHRKNIISTMQIERAQSGLHFQEISGVSFSYGQCDDLFPGLYSSKAGTQNNYRNFGINSYLRYLALKNAMNDSSINSLVGIGYEGAPRLNLLKRIGYRSVEVNIPKNGYTLPLSQPLLLSLKRTLFETAIIKLKEETVYVRDHFDIKLQMDLNSFWL